MHYGARYTALTGIFLQYPGYDKHWIVTSYIYGGSALVAIETIVIAHRGVGEAIHPLVTVRAVGETHMRPVNVVLHVTTHLARNVTTPVPHATACRRRGWRRPARRPAGRVG